MNPFVALIALQAFSAKPIPGSSSSTTKRVQRAHRKRTPRWPTVKQVPPLAATMPAVPAMPHEVPDAPTTTPAEQAARGDEPANGGMGAQTADAADADANTYQQLADIHARPIAPAHASQHVEQHARPTKRRKRPAVGVEVRSVADAQKVLRGLGWKGHLTTKGALSRDLTDGDYGPVTRDNWQQSARKRQLVPLFERVGPKTVRVNAGTYAALAKLSSGVAGLRLP
jgi:hypothetical protein